MDISAGAEMMQGIQSAKELNAELVLADRRIQTTFSRIWRKHSFWQKCKLLTSILFSLFDDEDITEADLEQLKQSDMLESALKEVGDSFPVVADVLIHERDPISRHKKLPRPKDKSCRRAGGGACSGRQRFD